MRSRYMRVVIDGDRSYIVYRRGLIDLIVGVETGRLAHAWRSIRHLIQDRRESMRLAYDPCKREPGTYLARAARKQRDKVRRAYAPKEPDSDQAHVGVEIEFFTAVSRDEIAARCAKAGLEDHVCLQGDRSIEFTSADIDCDGSCREDCSCNQCDDLHYYDNCAECGTDDCAGHACPGHDDYECQCECDCANRLAGHEIAVVAPAREIADVIMRVCSVLHDCQGRVNASCGLHVHLDVRRAHATRVYANLYAALPLLCAMVPVSRTRNHHCRVNTTEYMPAVNGRYWAINPQSIGEHSTVEVRLHSGTTDAEKINNWIELLRAIAYSRRRHYLSVPDDLAAYPRLRKSVKKYVASRVDRFAGDHTARGTGYSPAARNALRADRQQQQAGVQEQAQQQEVAHV